MIEQTFLGIAYDQALAGTVGGVVSLAFIRDLTPVKVWLAIFTGFACSAYLTATLSRLGITLVEKFVGPMKHERGDLLAVSFILGLLGVYLVAGVVKLADRFGTDPLDLIRRIRNGSGNP
ncbi:MAG: hypothetical protein Q8M53_10945 [Burkholderiales bacterium]|nr:hypothetical protein [Burkholderiales bacterium]